MKSILFRSNEPVNLFWRDVFIAGPSAELSLKEFNLAVLSIDESVDL